MFVCFYGNNTLWNYLLIMPLISINYINTHCYKSIYLSHCRTMVQTIRMILRLTKISQIKIINKSLQTNKTLNNNMRLVK